MAVEPKRILRELASEVLIFPNRLEAAEAAADRIASTITQSVEARGKAVLGLATGATPEPIYAGLVQRHKAGSLSFAKVTTYNLDEYYPMSPLDPNSYRSYMDRHLFRHVDLPANQAHVLDGSVPEEFAETQAGLFDRWIAADGGLDLQLLGLGRNGHIGFNEPSDLALEQALSLPTRPVLLDRLTIEDAVKDFGERSKVPRKALTMGTASILAARSVVILAFGQAKAAAVARSILGPVTAGVPGSLLQTIAGRVVWMLDEEAATGLLE